MANKIEERFQFRSVVFLVLKDEETVFLSRRANTGHWDGFYSFVGGHLDGGERAEDGLIREAHEEIGITIDPIDLRVSHVMQYRNKDNIEYFNVYFTATKWVGEILNMEPEKCDDLQWINVGNLPDNIIPYTKQALGCIMGGVFYSNFGY